MDDRGANIDIVFRNGLKDFEVLPPPGVFDNIHPAIKRKQRPILILRAAAIVSVVLTLGFLAYRFSREVSAKLENDAIAFNDVTIAPENNPVLTRPLPLVLKDDNSNRSPGIVFTENSRVISYIPDDEIIIFQEVDPIQEDITFPEDNSKPAHGPSIRSLISAGSTVLNFKEPGKLYPVESINNKGADRWSIGAMASPTYYSRVNSENDLFTEKLMESEKPVVSYSGGVSFFFKVSKKISIQSGFYYSSLGQEVTGINSYGGFQLHLNTKGDRNFEVLTTNGNIYTNNADVFLRAEGPAERVRTSYTNDVFDPEKAGMAYIGNTLMQNISYLELPILLRYKLIDKTIDFNLIGGFSYNMLVGNSVYSKIDGNKYPMGKTDGLNPISFSSSVGMGMEYNFSENLSLNLEPTFRYYLNPFTQITGSGNHPYSFGIFSGVSYRF